MKLFQQLLVAPAALGLMAPLAANAAELNVEGISDYSAASEQVSSISQFSDVHPTDWAYQALSSLVERYGCVAGDASGNFRGNQAMTRYEAAALLNACLDNVVEMSDDVRRLSNEFAPELAVLKGRLDGVEAQVGEMAAGQFSTTTKLSGQTVFVTGGVSYDNKTKAGKTDDSMTFTYATRLGLDTSFNGDDLLKTRIDVGNFGSTPFGSGAGALERAVSSTSDQLAVARSYYQFPVADNFTATVGAKVRQDDMLAVWPSSYPSTSMLDVLTYAGANAAYNLKLGAGAGISYVKDSFNASFNYVAADGDNADKGLFEDDASSNYTFQVAYTGDGYGVAGVYTDSDNGVKNSAGDYSAYGLSGWWSPSEVGMVPTISAGMGWKNPSKENDASNIEDETTWSIGLEWADVGVVGNTLGFGIGTAEGHRDDAGYDDPMAYELWYDIVVSDNISVTPSYFIVEQDGDGKNFSGALVKTTFTF